MFVRYKYQFPLILIGRAAKQSLRLIYFEQMFLFRYNAPNMTLWAGTCGEN